MADGTTLNPGSGGDKIWTEEVPGFGTYGKVSRSKLAMGAVGQDEGNVCDAHPMPVKTGDGSDVAFGAQADATAAADNSTASFVSLFKRLLARLTTLLVLPATLGQKAMAASLAVTVASDQSAIPVSTGTVSVTGSTVAVVGTFWQTTQPVSIAASVAVTGTFWQATQPVSGTITAVTTITNAVGTNADATIAPGTAPSKAFVVAGVYNASAPSPTNGQTLGIQLDSSGRLIVAPRKPVLAASVALTISLNSLAASTTVGRQSTVIDNSSTGYNDAIVTVIITTSSSTIGSSKSVSIYVTGSEDGTNFDQDDGVVGASDAAYTINSPTNLKLARVMNCPTSSKVYNATFTIAALFGGVMPRKWAIVVVEDTNQALASSGNSASFTGVT